MTSNSLVIHSLIDSSVINHEPLVAPSVHDSHPLFVQIVQGGESCTSCITSDCSIDEVEMQVQQVCEEPHGVRAHEYYDEHQGDEQPCSAPIELAAAAAAAAISSQKLISRQW